MLRSVALPSMFFMHFDRAVSRRSARARDRSVVSLTSEAEDTINYVKVRITVHYSPQAAAKVRITVPHVLCVSVPIIQ